MEADTEKLRQETVSQINELKKAEKLKKLELEQLKAGNKAYPGYLEEARGFLQRRLLEETGKRRGCVYPGRPVGHPGRSVAQCSGRLPGRK